MGEKVFYDESRGYLVFVLGEKDPIPYRPNGWDGVNYPLHLGRQTEQRPQDKKLGVAIDSLDQDSKRQIVVLYDRHKWDKVDYAKELPGDIQEVYRCQSMLVHLRCVGEMN